MRHLLTILRFGKPYLGRYWQRFLAGILLAWVFAASNGVLLGAIKTVLDRMSPPKIETPATTPVAVENKSWIKTEGEAIAHTF